MGCRNDVALIEVKISTMSDMTCDMRLMDRLFKSGGMDVLRPPSGLANNAI